MRTVVLLFLLAALTTASFFRNAVWRDDQTLWSDTIDKTPRNARAYNELGLHLGAAGNYREALRILNLSLGLDPYQPGIYANIGIMLEKLNRPDEAAEIYRRAIQYEPRDPTAYYNIGVLLYTVYQDRARALHYLRIAGEIDPMEPDVHHYLGMIYRDNGDIARAEEELARYRYFKHQ